MGLAAAVRRFWVLPLRPTDTDGWSAERLAGPVGRDVPVHVTVPWRRTADRRHRVTSG